MQQKAEESHARRSLHGSTYPDMHRIIQHLVTTNAQKYIMILKTFIIIPVQGFDWFLHPFILHNSEFS